jgi:hypothetical protein
MPNTLTAKILFLDLSALRPRRNQNIPPTSEKTPDSKKEINTMLHEQQSGLRNEKGQFLQGFTGNPAGRPKGSRNRLGEAFLEGLAADFEAHGAEAIAECKADQPDRLHPDRSLPPAGKVGNDGASGRAARYDAREDRGHGASASRRSLAAKRRATAQVQPATARDARDEARALAQECGAAAGGARFGAYWAAGRHNPRLGAFLVSVFLITY